MAKLQKIVPCLWFDGQAEQAAKFYLTVFEGRIHQLARYTKEGQDVHHQKPGTVLVVTFDLDGTLITALNGGPQFKLSEAMSLQVMCETQAEVDRYWDKLSAGGDDKAQQCGWLKDKFGLSWQIVPMVLPDLIGDPDVVKAGRTLAAMMGMKKLDIAKLKQAHDG